MLFLPEGDTEKKEWGRKSMENTKGPSQASSKTNEKIPIDRTCSLSGYSWGLFLSIDGLLHNVRDSVVAT